MSEPSCASTSLLTMPVCHDRPNVHRTPTCEPSSIKSKSAKIPVALNDACVMIDAPSRPVRNSMIPNTRPATASPGNSTGRRWMRPKKLTQQTALQRRQAWLRQSAAIGPGTPTPRRAAHQPPPRAQGVRSSSLRRNRQALSPFLQGQSFQRLKARSPSTADKSPAQRSSEPTHPPGYR